MSERDSRDPRPVEEFFAAERAAVHPAEAGEDRWEQIVHQSTRGGRPWFALFMGALGALAAVATPEVLEEMSQLAQAIRVDDAVVGYIVDLARRTRDDRAIELGAGERTRSRRRGQRPATEAAGRARARRRRVGVGHPRPAQR